MSEREVDGPEYVHLPGAAEIPPGQARAYPVGRYEVAVFNVNGEFYALDNTCPHQGAPIAEGWTEGPLVTCPWHAWCFDVRTGKMTLGEFAGIDRFAVRREGDAIYVSTEPIEQ